MYLIANFKENLNRSDFENYFKDINSYLERTELNAALKIIFCPPYPYLELSKELIKKHKNVLIGAQDVSVYKKGSHTGEVSAEHLSDYCKFCIVGHSERRKSFNETAENISQKMENLYGFNIIPIVCISNKEDLTKIEVKDSVLLTYEPIESIGGTEAEDNSSIERFYNDLNFDHSILYGGSVNSSNLSRLIKLKFLNGFLIGGASLKSSEFIKMIETLNNHKS